MSKADFDRFHNEVFNLPRDSFSNFGIQKVKSLAEYLYAIRDNFPAIGLTLVDIYLSIHRYLSAGNKIANPNHSLELLFDLSLASDADIKNHYNNFSGRKFRHWMELAALLELLGNSDSRRELSSFTEELCLAPVPLTKALLRDKVLSINTLNNPGLTNLASYSLYQRLNYRPAMGILKYIEGINRPCTLFELSVFFGRPNYNLNNEVEIVADALNQGRALPGGDRGRQLDLFFRNKGWVNQDGTVYGYVSSQQPDFKFRSFFILMDAVGLIHYNQQSHTATLTEYSRELLQPGTQSEVVIIERLLDETEQQTTDNSLSEKIVRNRAEAIDRLLDDPAFLDQINERAAHRSGAKIPVSETVKYRRDELIREVSKHKAGYGCQGCGNATFTDGNGNNFIESHHIIEYNSKEDGPDVLENLLVLCPNCHARVHFGRKDSVEEFYRNLRESNKITLQQFRDMHVKFKLLTSSHVDILAGKMIITNEEQAILKNLITEQ